MKKLLIVLCTFFIVCSFVGCSSEIEHKVTFVESKTINVADKKCVAVFTKYTNGSAENAVPADNLYIKAYQNGKEIPPIVPTGEKIDGYIQCDMSVQSGITADVVWIFQLEDESVVSVEMPNEEMKKITIK